MDNWLLALSAVLALGWILIFLAWQHTRTRLRDVPVETRQAVRLAADERRQRLVAEATAGALAEAASDALLVIRDDLRIQALNPSAAALFQRPSADYVGLSVIELTRHPELDQIVTDALEAGPRAHFAAPGESQSRQIVIGNRMFRVHTAPITLSAGAPAPGLPEIREERLRGGLVVALQDVSELQRLGRARRDMVANISHELRTPISSIRLLVDTLTHGALADVEMRAQLLDKIGFELDTLQQLAQEMLDLAQIESGQALLKLVPADVAELANAGVARLAPQAARKHQRLIVLPSPAARALVDPEQIGRVLGNLLHNAIKYAPTGGQIEVRWETLPESVVLSVSDDGPGVTPEDQSRIFERFYRADRSRAGEGSGLGLAIARHIVEAHGGRIWVESDYGRGATFRFSLHRADEPG